MLIKRGALSDANYQTTKLSKISSPIEAVLRVGGRCLVGSRLKPKCLASGGWPQVRGERYR